jgi:uncharacterized protein DUF475
VIMCLNAVNHISEVITGLIGAGFIVAAFVDSIRYNRRTRAPNPVADDVASQVEIRKIQNNPESSPTTFRRPTEPSRPE